MGFSGRLARFGGSLCIVLGVLVCFWFFFLVCLVFFCFFLWGLVLGEVFVFGFSVANLPSWVLCSINSHYEGVNFFLPNCFIPSRLQFQ